MPHYNDIMKTYNCGAVKVTRNNKYLSSEEKHKCFGYVEVGRCSALTEQLCKTKGRCPFWKEGKLEKPDYDY